MIDINASTSVVAFLMLVMVLFGYVPLLKMGLSRWARWIFAGVLMICAVSALRSFYWDIGQELAGDNWAAVRDYLGAQKFSTVFNIGVMVSCYILLRGRLYLIPKSDRWRWRWWNAWLHPRELCVGRLFDKKRK